MKNETITIKLTKKEKKQIEENAKKLEKYARHLTTLILSWCHTNQRVDRQTEEEDQEKGKRKGERNFD